MTLTAADIDPYRFRNWLRMGTTSSLLSVLLMTVIDFVIRHVEANGRAVTEALVRLQVAAAERAKQEHDLRVAYDRLGQLHQKLEATKEEERRFLSRELHDELGQTLTALKLRLQLGERATAPPSNIANPSTEPIALVDDLISRVRKISVDLRPPLLDEVGLVSALRVYLESQARISGLAIDLEADEPGPGTAARLPSDLEIACFRVVQESITNALRHASARRLRVRIVRSATRISLSVEDDGRGFDLGSARRGRGERPPRRAGNARASQSPRRPVQADLRAGRGDDRRGRVGRAPGRRLGVETGMRRATTFVIASLLAATVATATFGLGVAVAAKPPAGELVVFEAASLKDAFATLAARFEKDHAGTHVVTNAAGSQELRAQIEHGAVADVFASADQRHMDALATAGIGRRRRRSSPATSRSSSFAAAWRPR